MPDVTERIRRLASALAGHEAEPPPGLEAGTFAEAARSVIAAAEAAEARPAVSPDDDCLARIFAGLHRLPVRDRALLVLWTLERLPAAELAEVLGHPAGLVLGHAAELAAGLYADAMRAGAGCRILIAEDERITALELKEALEEMGHEVPWVATSAGQAISMASMHRPHLAIVDIRLKGGTDGVSAARELQETLRIPVILTTAYTDQAERAGAVEPYGFLPKPWTAEDLLRTVQSVLARIAIERWTPGLREDPPGPAD